MRNHQEPFSWDDWDDEIPVPLGGVDAANAPKEPVGQASAVVEEPAEVVWGAQDAIAREDADPAIPLSLFAAAPDRFALQTSGAQTGNVAHVARARWRPLKAAAVVAGCLIAFAHGWNEGSTAAESRAAGRSGVAQEPSILCEPDHCSGELTVQGWKEVQNR